MTRSPWHDWPLPRRIAAIALGGALLLDLAVLLRTRHLGAEGAVRPLQIGAVPELGRRAPDDPSAISEAARRGPFGGDAPAMTQPVAMGSAQPIVPVAPDRPRLVGTVVEGDGRGFVMVELPDSRMQLVRIGERVGTLRLKSVSAGAAVFEGANGERVSLRSPQAGAGSIR